MLESVRKRDEASVKWRTRNLVI